MIPSLSAAVTGIDANQTMLDVAANNIANVNTTGFQASEVQFADLLNQQIVGATAPTVLTGGTNPVMVGSGTKVVANEISFAQGTIQQTGQPSDVAIQGNGFLVVNQGGQNFYTRDGNLSLNALGQLETSTGALVQGWLPGANGVINPNGPTAPIVIPQGQVEQPQQTTQVQMTGNLPANDTQTPIDVTVTTYDALGNTVPLQLTFTPQGNDTWQLSGTDVNTGAALWPAGALPTLTFTNGQLTAVSGANGTAAAGFTLPVANSPFANGAAPTLFFPPDTSTTAVTQYAGNQTIEAPSQNGYPSGTLESYSIGSDGVISGTYSNGQTQSLGQIALAGFANEEGLARIGNNVYQATVASGPAQVGVPGAGGRGTLIGGSLEGSNVNLGTELTNLIIAQNAYQANTKVVTTTDQVLQALENMP
jgi:flagellar hook protein FlgE